MFPMFPDKAPMLGFSNKFRFAVMVKFSLTPPSNKCLNLENNGNSHFNRISDLISLQILAKSLCLVPFTTTVKDQGKSF